MPRVRELIPDPGTYYGLRPDGASIRGRHIPTIPVTYYAGSVVVEDGRTFGGWRDVGLSSALADALALEHGGCDDASCDIGEAMRQGLYRVAAHLLMSATECEIVESVVEFYAAWRGEDWPDMYSDPEWPAWQRYHIRHGWACDACGSYTYADGWTPDGCAACGADYPGDDGRLHVS